jgi:hypothetical protein
MSTNSMKGYGYIEKQGDNKFIAYLKKYCNEQNFRFSLTNPLLIEAYNRDNPESACLRQRRKIKKSTTINTDILSKKMVDISTHIINNEGMDGDTKDMILLLIKEVERISNENEWMKKEIEMIKDRDNRDNREKKKETLTKKNIVQEKLDEWVMKCESSQSSYSAFVKSKMYVTNDDIDRMVDNPKQPIIDILVRVLEQSIQEIRQNNQETRQNDEDYTIPIISVQERGKKAVYVCVNQITKGSNDLTKGSNHLTKGSDDLTQPTSSEVQTQTTKYEEITNDQIVFFIKEMNYAILKRISAWKKISISEGNFTEKKDDGYLALLNKTTNIDYEKLVDKFRQALYRVLV